MTTFSKDYRQAFNEAVTSNSMQKATDIFNQLCEEAGVPNLQDEDDDDNTAEDPKTVKIQIDIGKKIAELRNKQNDVPGGIKI